MQRLLLFILTFLLLQALRAQEQAVADTVITEELMMHSPRKATIMSAALPGLGQVYNQKYWKVPIVYAGLGTCIYFIHRNNSRFQLYKDALVAELDGDPATLNTTIYTSGQLDQLQDTYRRWRDLSWIFLAGVYILNVLDANVDAHLFYFDVSRDLSLNIQPYLAPSARVNTGLSLILNF